jgi:hypothetical protein
MNNGNQWLHHAQKLYQRAVDEMQRRDERKKAEVGAAESTPLGGIGLGSTEVADSGDGTSSDSHPNTTTTVSDIRSSQHCCDKLLVLAW